MIGIKCKEQYLSYCIITLEGVDKEINSCDFKIKEDREKRKKLEKKTTLDDL